LVWIGVGESVGGVLNGQLEDRYGAKRVCYFYFAELTVAFAFLFWYTALNEFNPYRAALLNFFWGIQDSAANNFIWCVCGF
jgi:predicted MFS family arabinose efflux permease